MGDRDVPRRGRLTVVPGGSAGTLRIPYAGPVRLARGPRWIVGGVVVAVALSALWLFVLRPAPSGIDRARSLVAWDGSCISVDTTREAKSADLVAWPRAVERVTTFCQNAGPGLLYARFPDQPTLRADLLAAPPSLPLCVAGNEVLLDLLDPGQFAKLCRQLDGRLVDGTRGVPEAEGTTLDEIDRSLARYERRAAAAQGRALRRLWAQAPR